MKIIDKMKEKEKKSKKEITTIYYAYQNPKVKLLPKIILIFTVGYALSPIDLIPDFIPILGYLDDLLVIPALITLAIKLIPDEVMEESRERALSEPLTIKKNWFFASVFILIWVVLLSVVVSNIVRFGTG